MPKGIYKRTKTKFQIEMAGLKKYVKENDIDWDLVLDALFPVAPGKIKGNRNGMKKVLSEEHRRKIGLKSKGRKHTDESKLKMRIAKLGDFHRGQEEWRKFQEENDRKLTMLDKYIRRKDNY